MTTVKFSNGQTANFDGNPTQQDIEEVAHQMGLNGGGQPDAPAPTNAPAPTSVDMGNIIPNNPMGNQDAFSSGMNQSTAPVAPAQDPSMFNAVPKAASSVFEYGGAAMKVLADPVVKVGNTLLTGAEMAISPNQSGQIAENAMNHSDTIPVIGSAAYHAYLDNPDMTYSDAATQGLLDTAGTAASALSYVVAPLKITGTGFMALLSGLKASLPTAAMTGAGEGLQAAGKGDSTPTSLIKGAEATIGATAAFGLMSLASHLVSNYGLKLLQSPATTNLMNNVTNWLPNLMKQAPDLFDKSAFTENRMATAEFLSNNFKAASQTHDSHMTEMLRGAADEQKPPIGNIASKVDAMHQNIFDEGNSIAQNNSTNFAAKLNSAIDEIKPNVPDPISAQHKIYLGISDAQGSFFKKANDLYSEITPDLGKTTEVPAYNAASSVLKSDPKALQNYPTASYVKTQIDSMVGDGGIGVRDAINLIAQSNDYIQQASSAQEVSVIRDMVSGAIRDVRKFVPPEDIAKWDLAHGTWQHASSMWSDPILAAAKNSGTPEGTVKALMTMKKASPARDVLISAINSNPQNQELIMATVLGRARTMDNETAQAYIDTFVKSVSDSNGASQILTPENLSKLKDIQSISNRDVLKKSPEEILKSLGLSDIGGNSFTHSVITSLSTLPKTSPERDLLVSALGRNPQNQDLIIHTVLSRVQQMDIKTANKYLSDFVQGVTDGVGHSDVFTSAQMQMLQSFKDFSAQDLRRTTYDMRDALGLSDPDYVKFISGQEKMDIYGSLQKGSADDLGKISDNFNRMVIQAPEKIGKIVADYSDKEKQTLGVMLMQDLMEKQNRLLVPDPAHPGKEVMGTDVVNSFKDIYQKINNAQDITKDNTLYGLFTKDETDVIENAFAAINNLGVLTTPAKSNIALTAMQGVMAAMYLKMGYVTGGSRSIVRMVAGNSRTEGVTTQHILDVMKELKDTGVIDYQSTIPDTIHALNQHFFPQGAGKAMSNITEDDTAQ